jgi:hypothetical protein
MINLPRMGGNVNTMILLTAATSRPDFAQLIEHGTIT